MTDKQYAFGKTIVNLRGGGRGVSVGRELANPGVVEADGDGDGGMEGETEIFER